MIKMVDEIKLKEVFLYQRKVRFLLWKPPDKISVDCANDKDYIPLFLGADVLADCNILLANLPRTHARFHKCGLSTKVSFPASSRVAGIHGSSRGVWFYSIQGLFRVAFEYYSREEQLDCLGTFSNLWKQRIGDSPLNEGIIVEFCDKLNVTHSPEVRQREMLKHLNQKLINTASNNVVLDSTATSEVRDIDAPVHDLNSIRESRIYMSEKMTKIKELLFELTNLFETKSGDVNHDADNICLLDYLTFITKEYKSTLTCDYLNVASTQEPIGENRALCIISRWLGTMFYEFRDKVSERASEFKRKNIGNIHNLPKAASVVDELFPQVMKIFLLSWIEGGEQKYGAQEKDVCDARSTSKLALPKSPFPVIQMILELASQTLVSGVAHVLYSRLVQAESVN